MIVILIGDSIRTGYQPVVRREMQGIAAVCGPDANCGDSACVLEHLDEWVISQQPDVVHLNCGLHDIKREYGSRKRQVPLLRYRANVEAIVSRLVAETNATVVWASTTPVNERWHHGSRAFDRSEADVRAYNAASRRIVARFEIAVNDLFAVVSDAGRDTLLLPDGVHFSDTGYEVLGSAVAEAIRAAAEAATRR